MFKKISCTLFIATLTVSASPAFTDPSALDPAAAGTSVDGAFVSLDVLVSEVLEKNPELRFYEAEIAAARGGKNAASRLTNPEVNGSVGQKRERDRDDELLGEGDAWSVSVMQPLEWPGRLMLRTAIADRDIALAELAFEEFKAFLAARAKILASDLVAARAKADAAHEVTERFHALRDVMTQRDPAGITPLLETRVIEATELNMHRKSGEALLVAKAAQLELNQLRGAGPEMPLPLKSSDQVLLPLQDRAALVTAARSNNFKVRARVIELTKQGYRVDLEKSSILPTVSIGPSFSEESAEGQERSVGAVIALQVPLWDQNQGGVETAQARRTQAEISLDVTRREIEHQVMQAALTYETKLQEITEWRPDAVRYFKEAAELADRHYRLGGVSISTYMELQKQYLEVVEGLQDTRKEALEAAVRLELLTGVSLPLSDHGGGVKDA